jgi:hypothetical protein
MPINRETALSQLSAVIDSYPRGVNKDDFAIWLQAKVLARSAIERLAPPGSPYLDELKGVLEWQYEGASAIVEGLFAIVKALHTDYMIGGVQTFRELVHADLFADFLDMAEHLLEESYKDAAAVIAGGVLEEHLRKLCEKHGIVLPEKPKLDAINAELAKAGVYGKTDQKQVTAWAGRRNEAAHAEWTKYSVEDVKVMLAGVRVFVSKYPA